MKISIYILTFLLFQCNNTRQNESTTAKDIEVAPIADIKETKKQIQDSLYFITKCDTIPLELLKISSERKSFVTFQKQTYIYCSPSAQSQIIDSIPFNTKIISWKPIVRSYKPEQIERNGKLVTINTAKENWYESNINGSTGYFLEYGMILKALGNNILFGENHFGKKQGNAPYQILSYDKDDKNKIIDSMELNRNHGHEIELLVYNGLDLSEGVIRYRDFRQSCPGTSSTNFIAVDKQGYFKKIASSYNGTESSSTIYFPLKFGSGKVLLVADGNINEIFNHYSGELNTYKYPKELNIPIEQLIIETKVEYAGDIEGLAADEIEIKSSETNFYQWNGKELIKIKTSDNGNM